MSDYLEASYALQRAENPDTVTINEQPRSCSFAQYVPGPDIKSTAWNCGADGFTCGSLDPGQWRRTEGILIQLSPGVAYSIPYMYNPTLDNGLGFNLSAVHWFGGPPYSNVDLWLSASPGQAADTDCTSAPAGTSGTPSITVQAGYCEPPNTGYINIKATACQYFNTNEPYRFRRGGGDTCLIRIFGPSEMRSSTMQITLGNGTTGGRSYICPADVNSPR